MLKLDLLKYTGDILPDIGKGTYVLLLFLKRDKEIVIGRGKNSSPTLFRAGYYAYVGSAQGPGGLRSRIHRHLLKEKKSVWHIDFLRKEALLVEVWADVHEERQEGYWADALIAMKGSGPIDNFGNTDDKRSRTHLCRFDSRPFLPAFSRLIMQTVQKGGPIHRSP
ncbi:MAG: GIY-YIG nuclease family protein [Deltaproteobacteria bacterium]|nr:GIY-YIG nuclease family protein [Deltaproteobacteria bacterium]